MVHYDSVNYNYRDLEKDDPGKQERLMNTS